MTELGPYVGARVHLHIWPHAFCETGRLSVSDGYLTLSTVPGFRLPLDEFVAHRTPFGPAEIAHSPDLVLLDSSDRMVSIWRDREPPSWC